MKKVITSLVSLVAVVCISGCAAIPTPTTPDACRGKYCVEWFIDPLGAGVVICAGSQSILDADIADRKSQHPMGVTKPVTK